MQGAIQTVGVLQKGTTTKEVVALDDIVAFVEYFMKKYCRQWQP